MKKEWWQRDSIIKLGILVFWSFFWLLNVLDKFIGGPTYLWVGRDRFAQLVKFFGSIGISNPDVATGALIITTLLEIFALVFVLGALISFFRKRPDETKTLFFWSTFSGLVVFSFFSIGDQIFGDRFELLEHTLFWIAIIISWGAFIWFPKEEKIPTKKIWKKYHKDMNILLLLLIGLGLTAMILLPLFSTNEFEKRTTPLEPVHVGNGVYKFEFSFLAGRTVWETSLMKFIDEHPHKKITQVYTAPDALKSKKADNLIIYIFTEPKS